MRKCENAQVVMYRLRKSKNAEASAKVCVKCESYASNTWRFKFIQAHTPIVNRLSSSIVMCRCNHRYKQEAQLSHRGCAMPRVVEYFC